MSWRNDHLGIQFAHGKCNQNRGDAGYVRACYANPFDPAVCVLLNLGLYLMIFPGVLHGIKLFEGGTQNGKYMECIRDACATEGGAESLEREGLLVSDLGTHCHRKGGGTHAGQASGAAGMDNAIELRMGHKLAGNSHRYIKYVVIELYCLVLLSLVV